MKIRDASQQKTVQLSVCAWEKTNNITQWTVDSKPHKNNCLFGPHGPKLKALLFHTKKRNIQLDHQWEQLKMKIH